MMQWTGLRAAEVIQLTKSHFHNLKDLYSQDQVKRERAEAIGCKMADVKRKGAKWTGFIIANSKFKSQVFHLIQNGMKDQPRDARIFQINIQTVRRRLGLLFEKLDLSED